MQQETEKYYNTDEHENYKPGLATLYDTWPWIESDLVLQSRDPHEQNVHRSHIRLLLDIISKQSTH